jgi:hypothetical protein
MSHYRKIATRIWDDERFFNFSSDEKVVWQFLLTHRTITPVGAGTPLIPTIEGYTKVRNVESILCSFSEQGMIYIDNHLIIVKNFLLDEYNKPNSPHQLAGWIEACEDLPKSKAFIKLRDYLSEELKGVPQWLFAGLLDPLANQQPKGLRDAFWERVKPYTEKPSGSIPRGIPIGVPQLQEQDQEQDQEQYSRISIYKNKKNVVAAKKKITVDNSPVIISLPIKDGTEFNIHAHIIKTWQEIYQHVDVLAALKKIQNRQLANPHTQLTKRKIMSYITNWLHKDNEEIAAVVKKREETERQVAESNRINEERALRELAELASKSKVKNHKNIIPYPPLQVGN